MENLFKKSSYPEKVLMLINGKEEFIDRSQLLKRFKVDGLVRIPEDEYGNIKMDDGEFGHFNLEGTNHVVGKKYLILKIRRHGKHMTDLQAEQPPLLSTDGAIIAVCTQVENNLPYSELRKAHFKHSMNGIADIASLSSAIQKRYASVTSLSNEEIMSKGIGFTLFRVVEKVNE